MAKTDDQLAALRRDIDAIDSQLHDLLMRRTDLAVKVGEVKAMAQPIGTSLAEGAKFIRPAREALILRRLVGRHHGKLPRGVVVRMWREMISALLQVEGPFAVAVYAPADRPGFWDMARDHYGSRVPVTVCDRLNQTVSAVLDGKATVAILPFPNEDDPEPWWPHLIGRAPHVIARLPFGDPGNQRNRGLQALVIGAAQAEPTGRDRSLVVIETVGQVSRSSLRDALNACRLEPTLIQSRQNQQGPELHLIEIREFLARDDARLANLAHAVGDGARATWIGGYAEVLTAQELAGTAGLEEAAS
jgi:chorismate mutase / prephenate dehydratase